MCLAVPMKIIEIRNNMAIAASGGIKREINVELMKNIKVGEYVMVHAGFAIERVNDKKAKETLAFMRKLRMSQ